MKIISAKGKKWLQIAGTLSLSIILLHCVLRPGLEVIEVTTEYASNPVGIDSARPRFSWILDSDQRGQQQTAYQILVAGSLEMLDKDEGDLWDSGKIDSDRSIHIPYQGKSLESNRCYFLKVRVWDKDQKPGSFSQVATFTTALLKPKEWTAAWIGRGGIPEPPQDPGFLYQQPVSKEGENAVNYNPRSLLLRKNFNISKEVKQALLHISGLGYYELSLNGSRVGNYVLSPAKTFYKKIILYDSYDVSAYLQSGENAIGIMLGNGWFNPLPKWWSWRMQWYGPKRAILQLHLLYTDGTEEMIGTDGQWKINDGPVVSSCIYDGEIYDANREIPRWDQSGFDDAGWNNAALLPSPGGILTAQRMPKIEEDEILAVQEITTPKKGIYVVDLGQNISGWVRATITGQKGDTLTLRYAENIDRHGMIDTKTNNLAAATDKYILSGEERETYEPRFTYHGFRYVELSGPVKQIKPEDVEAVVVHSAVPASGSFSCSDENLNRIHRATIWSQKANLMGMPTDCPQRDERLGWIGDAHVTAEEAIYNFDMALFYQKWMNDIRSTRHADNGDIPYISPRPFTDGVGTPAWSSGYLLIVWYLYQYYADESILADHFEAMCQYVDYLASTARDLILPPDQYGDWLSPDIDWRRGDPPATTTAYFYYTSRIVAKAAGVLKKTEIQQKYDQLADRIKSAYNKKFYNYDIQAYEKGSQFSNSFPLFLGIAEDFYKKAALGGLVADILNRKGHLSTGILGTKYMMETLAWEEHNNIAYLVVTQPDYPGWIDLIRGRTTLSEHWNQGGSNNHVMFGSIDSWFYKVLAGIRIDEKSPAFKNIIIKPYIAPELSWVKADTKTIRGQVGCQWKKTGDEIQMSVLIPANSTATVYVLASKPERVEEGGIPAASASGVTFFKMDGKYAVYQVGSGFYEFSSDQISSALDTPFAARPVIAPPDTSAFIPDSLRVTMTTKTPDAEIRYTLDNKIPSQESLLYEEPFILHGNSKIKARTFRKGYHPSFTSISEISFVDPKVNGLNYNLYQGSWTQLPDFSRLTPNQTGIVYSLGLETPGLPKYDFALQFKGWILIKSEGTYQFYTMSNDGSCLAIDNHLVVNNDGEHMMEEKSGSIMLTPGRHAIEVTYFQSGGGKGLTVMMEGPGTPKQTISPMIMFQSK